MCQVSEDSLSWHIPYDDGRLLYSYDLPQTWLCVTHSQLNNSSIQHDTHTKHDTHIHHDTRLHSMRDMQVLMSERKRERQANNFQLASPALQSNSEHCNIQKFTNGAQQTNEINCKANFDNKKATRNRRDRIDIKSLFP